MAFPPLLPYIVTFVEYALTVSFLPLLFWLVYAFPDLVLRNGAFVPRTPPRHSTKCWLKHLSSIPNSTYSVDDEAPPFVNGAKLRKEILKLQDGLTPSQRHRYDFVPIVYVSFGIYHIKDPDCISDSDLDHIDDQFYQVANPLLNFLGLCNKKNFYWVHIDELPNGWYGLDPDFFNDSPLKNAILGLHIHDYSVLYNRDKGIANVYVDKKSAHWMDRVGIPKSIPHAPTTDHPLCYTLENRNLQIAATFLGKDWYALWLNPKKHSRLASITPVPTPSGWYSKCLNGKDIARYPQHTTGPPTSQSPVWFAHDALQHLTERNVGDFFDGHSTLKLFVATLVVPPETLFDLDPMWPAVYNFDIDGDDLYFLPDGSANGAYRQPLSARNWLLCKRFTTPRNECIHVSVVHTVYAHHVLVFSRSPLLPEDERVWDLPAAVLIPSHSHPTGSYSERVTDPQLVADLIAYANRQRATSLPDLHSKTATGMQYIYGKYSTTAINAAVCHAMAVRNMAYQASSRNSYYYLWLSYVTGVWFLAFDWYIQSFTSKQVTNRKLKPIVWRVKTKVTAASPSQKDIPNCFTACDLSDLPDSHVPYHGGVLAHFAVANARLHYSLWVKIIAFPLWQLVASAAQSTPYWVQRVIFLLDVNFHTWPGAMATLIIILITGIKAPPIPTPKILKPLRRACYNAYCWLFYLTRASRLGPTGGSYLYQLAILGFTVNEAAPRLIPGYLYHRFPPTEQLSIFVPDNTTVPVHRTQRQIPILLPGHYETLHRQVHTYSASRYKLIVAMFMVTIMLVEWFRLVLLHRHNDVPHHTNLQHVELGPDPPTPDPPPAPTPPTPPPQPPKPPSATSSNSTEGLYADPSEPPTRPSSPPAPEVVPPALPTDPLLIFKRNPAHYDDLATLIAHLRTLPVPAIHLDENNRCVWSTLARAYQLEPDLMWHVWLASLPKTVAGHYVAHQPTVNELTRIFAFFRVGLTLHTAQRGGPDVAFFNPEVLPNVLVTPEPGWPNVTAYVFPNPDGSLHMTVTGHPVVGAMNPPLNPNREIRIASRVTTPEEMQAVVNVPPAGAYVRVYDNLHHGMNRASPLTDVLTQNTVPYRGVFVNLPVTRIQADVTMYRFTRDDVNRAANLAADLKKYPEQFEASDMQAKYIVVGIDIRIKRMQAIYSQQIRPPSSVRVHMLAGVGGAAKSTVLSQYLQQLHSVQPFNSANLRIHCWQHRLRGKLKTQLQAVFPFLQAMNFATRGMPLLQELGGTLVLDDATMLWPGFIELVCLINPTITDVVITADTCQQRTVFGKPDALTRLDMSTSEWLTRFNDNYATEQFRYSHEISDVFGLPRAQFDPAFGPPPAGAILLCTSAPHNIPVLVVSPRFAETQNNSGVACTTFQDSQGHTIDGDYAIDLTGLTATVTDYSFWTAVTRGRGNIYLVMGPSLIAPRVLDEVPFAKSGILSAIMAVAARAQTYRVNLAADPDRLIAIQVQSHIARSIGITAATRLGLVRPCPAVGKYVHPKYRAPWLSLPRQPIGDYYTARTHRAVMERARGRGNPAFSYHMVTHVNRRSKVKDLLRHYMAVTNETVLVQPGTSYQLPPYPNITALPDPRYHVDYPFDEKYREVYLDGTNFHTHVNIDDGPVAPQHHLGRDKVLMEISLRKRIKVGDDTGPATAAELMLAQKMYRGLAKFVDVPTVKELGFQPHLFEMCANSAHASWIGKRTQKAMERSVSRDDLDRMLNWVNLFLKQQIVKKPGKLYKNAQPGQIVSEFPLAKQFRDAIFAAYLEKIIMAHAFDTTYLHSRASPDDLSKYYRKHWVKGMATANDWTAWDSGCNKSTVMAVAQVLRDVGIPEDYIDTYIYDRTHVRSFMGPHATKQESGDRWTWLVNTLVNMMITGATLACPPRTPAAFSGDDSIVAGLWRRPTDYNPRDWAMTPKLETGSILEFCGFLFGHDDIYLKPLAILQRAQYGLALGRSDIDFWRSIHDAICEVGVRTQDYDVELATADFYLREAVSLFQLPLDFRD